MGVAGRGKEGKVPWRVFPYFVEEGVQIGGVGISLGGGGVEEWVEPVDAVGVLAAGSDHAEHAIDVDAVQEGGGLKGHGRRQEGVDVGGEVVPARGGGEPPEVRHVEEHRRLPLQPAAHHRSSLFYLPLRMDEESDGNY